MTHNDCLGHYSGMEYIRPYQHLDSMVPGFNVKLHTKIAVTVCRTSQMSLPPRSLGPRELRILKNIYDQNSASFYVDRLP